jgi:enoyl-CoA hydratase/carnithine racemase
VPASSRSRAKERRNALNLQVKQEIVEGLHALLQDEEIAAIVLTGDGGCFVAGTDIAKWQR